MAGIITEFAALNRRYMTSLAAALGWGQPAEAQARAAAEAGRRRHEAHAGRRPCHDSTPTVYTR
jgi:hypothetical protein